MKNKEKNQAHEEGFAVTGFPDHQNSSNSWKKKREKKFYYRLHVLNIN